MEDHSSAIDEFVYNCIATKNLTVQKLFDSREEATWNRKDYIL